MSFVNRRVVTIEWRDCDAAGIVFYPRYFAMFAAALGYRKPAMIRRFGLIGDDVTIEIRVTKCGHGAIEIEHGMYRDGAVLGAKCWETDVWAASEGTPIKGVPVPEEVRTALGHRA